MAKITYLLGSDDLTVAVTVTEREGALDVRVTVLDDTGTIGDLNALFLDIADPSLLGGLSATGDDVTGSVFKAGGVTRIDNFTNIAGEVTQEFGKFDLGVQFGTMGIGVDDIRTTTFTLAHDTLDLTLDHLLLMDSAVRLTSVGEEGGAREESLKIGGIVQPLTEGPVVDGPEVGDDGPVIGGEGPVGEGPVDEGPVVEGPVVEDEGPVLGPDLGTGEDGFVFFAAGDLAVSDFAESEWFSGSEAPVTVEAEEPVILGDAIPADDAFVFV